MQRSISVSNSGSGSSGYLILPPKEFIVEQLSGVPVQLPIFICLTGHYTQEPKKCPLCRSKVIKCEFLEGLIRNSTFLCPHEGCGEVKSGAEFQSHADNFCHYRPIRCPFAQCQTLVPFRFYFEHLTSRHQIPGSDDSTNSTVEIPLAATHEAQFKIFYKRFENKIFFIRSVTSLYECIFWVELFGGRNDEKEFTATVKLVGKRGHKTVVRFPVSPVRTDLDALNKTLACCQLSGKSVRQYFINNPTIVNVSIQFFLEESNVEETLC